MSSETMLFGECANLVRSSTLPSLYPDSPYIALEHINQATLNLNGYAYGRDADSQKTKFSKGDILFGKLRPYFRKVVIAPFDGLCSTDIWVVRPKGGIDRNFLFYWMASEEFINRSTDTSEGTRMPRAKWDVVSKFATPMLHIDEQREIGATLRALDDRIALLRETNTTLEAIAQALFKSWFVDFDPVRAKQEGREPEGMDADTAALFPDSFEESELGLIPKGWKIGMIKDIGEVICGKTPPTSEPANYGDDVPFITIPDMHNQLVVTTTKRSLSWLGANTQKNKTIPAGSICVSCIATAGLVVRVASPSQTNQQINSVVPFVKWGNSFPLFTLRRIGDAVRASGSGGSVFHNLNKTGFEQLLVLFPTEQLAIAFSRISEPIVEKIIINQKHSETLTSLRDTLLPRLISGQLRIPEAEALIEETAA